MTLSQFYVYAKYANEQKAYKLDIKSLNEYLNLIFGKGNSSKSHMLEDDPNNYIWSVAKAKESLIKKTGRKEFALDEILDEINKLKKANHGIQGKNS